MRDELLNEAPSFGLGHARSAVARWGADHTLERPHSALGDQAPATCAAQLTATGERLRTPISARAARPLLHPRPRAKLTPGLQLQLAERRGPASAL
jgi:putative transposase